MRLRGMPIGLYIAFNSAAEREELIKGLQGTAAIHTIGWIAVKHRVPADRKRVLVSGFARVIGIGPKTRFEALSRFNHTANMFDIERFDRFWARRVTHWAEVISPES